MLIKTIEEEADDSYRKLLEIDAPSVYALMENRVSRDDLRFYSFGVHWANFFKRNNPLEDPGVLALRTISDYTEEPKEIIGRILDDIADKISLAGIDLDKMIIN